MINPKLHQKTFISEAKCLILFPLVSICFPDKFVTTDLSFAAEM